MSTDVLVAKESFSTETRAVTEGETFREGHPVVEGREEFFEPFTVDNELEDASAAPGKKRRGRKSKNQTEAPPEPETPADPQTEGETPADGAETPAAPVDYSGFNMKELKAQLDERGIEYSAPPGTSKADLAALLTAADSAS